ncbi:olfactory receptor 14I1-like [Tachyglossus aculeatus]|uniref:olfactory receptor 14I1-like n=1 Tax=Tachyglossus aculeatus TaxID=9261 RepID=UPI0018F301C6|nr:olfactory receptor 14I1-like [Tachyglossus aculeatus]
MRRSISFLGCVTQVFLVVFFVTAEYFVLTITCSEDHVAINVSITAAVPLAVICFILIIFSYACIFWAVLRMPAAESPAKAFSTCLPHLVVVILFLMTSFFAYLKPPSDSPSVLDLLLSMFYTVEVIISYQGLSPYQSPSHLHVQVFSVVWFATSELFILSVMFHDCYATICLPLSYEVVMLVSVFYTLVPPSLNYLIYSLRNRVVKAVMGRILKGDQPSPAEVNDT